MLGHITPRKVHAPLCLLALAEDLCVVRCSAHLDSRARVIRLRTSRGALLALTARSWEARSPYMVCLLNHTNKLTPRHRI